MRKADRFLISSDSKTARCGARGRQPAGRSAGIREQRRARNMLFADGGGRKQAKAGLQSAAVGRRRTARLKEPQTSNGKVFGPWPAGNATMRMPLRASAGQRLRPARLCESQSPMIFYTLPFVRTKGNRKTAAVKRFRGRPCAFAESDAYGTFEAIKSSLTQTFSRLGKARTSSALLSAYRKRSPILYAPSPRPPSVRNRFCRG